MTQIVRTHDAFYLNENRYKEPKELHKLIIGAMADSVGDGDVIADFGCAAGEFPFALRARFPDAVVEGYDLLPELIAKAKREVPGVDFFVGSITDPNLCALAHVDYALCTGVLQIFDAFEPIIDNLLRWTKPGGVVFLHGLFNNFPIDVNVKYSLSESYGSGVLEPGWNVVAKQTVSRWLESRADVDAASFTDFSISIDLAPQSDPVRSWTMLDDRGQRHIVNGLGLIQPHSILRIDKKH